MLKKLHILAALMMVAYTLVFCGYPASLAEAGQGISAALFEEHFSGGTLDNIWLEPPSVYFNDSLQAVSDPSTPGGDSWVGELADWDASFYGKAKVYSGQSNWTNITVTADVYCKDTLENGAPVEGGIYARVDTTTDIRFARFFAALQDDRVFFQTLEGTWSPPNVGSWRTYSWTGVSAPAGWHKMKLTIQEGWITCYFDDMDTALPGCPLYSEVLGLTLSQGAIGVGVQNVNYSGNPGAAMRFDDILVTQAPPLATLSGTVTFSDGATSQVVIISLYRTSGGAAVAFTTTAPGGGPYSLSGIPLATYNMVFFAPGYQMDDTTHTDIMVTGDSISGLDVVLDPSGESPYSISGNVSFADGSATARATLQACIDKTDVVVSTATTQLGSGAYVLDNLFPGSYDIVVTAEGYHTDRSTLTDLGIVDDHLTGQHVQLYPPEYRVYHGNLHSHTSYSDGRRTPADAYAFAREVAQIDFLAVTDHDLYLTPAEFADIRAQAATFTQEEVFVAVAGYEWSENVGHINVFETDYVATTSDLTTLYSALAASGCPATFNHPGPTYGDFNGFAYSSTGDQALCLVEVRNNNEQAEYFKALDNGWHIGADGSQDNHGPNWGACSNLTGLLATSLTKPHVLEAMRSRRSFSAGDRNFELLLLANGHWMGEAWLEYGGTATLVVKAYDPDPWDTIAQLILYENGTIISSVSPTKQAHTWTLEVSAPSFDEEHYYVAKAVQEDGDCAWSAPLWITFTTATPTPTPTPTPSPTPIHLLEFDFESGSQGWQFHTIAPGAAHLSHWDDASSLVTSSAIGVATLADESTNYFALWDSLHATAVPYHSDSLYQVDWLFSTDSDSANSVPSLRFRIGLDNQKAFAYARLHPGGWLPAAKYPDSTEYQLFFKPPMGAEGLFLAFSLIDWSDDFRGSMPFGELYLEEVTVYHHLLSSLTDWQHVAISSDLDAWTTAGSPPYELPVFARSSGTLLLSSGIGSDRVFGCWDSPLSLFTMAPGPLYRLTWVLSSNPQLGGPDLRLRIHSGDFRYSWYNYYVSSYAPGESGLPPESGAPYHLYFTQPYGSEPCQVSFDLIDFSPDYGGTLTLHDLSLDWHDL